MLLINGPGCGGCSVRGWLHPRGCMRARVDHLDVEVASRACLLYSLARVRGVMLPCEQRGRGFVVYVPEVGAHVSVSALDERLALRCRRRVYLMVTRGGRLYLAPVWAEEL